LSSATSASLVRAQQPAQPIFRSGTRLIVENVTVKDKNGNPVEGLTASDFAITEDGEPQVISFVEFQRLVTEPSPAGAPSASSPPAAVEQPGSKPPSPQISSGPAGSVHYRDKRLVVLYFDLTAMPPNDQIRAYAAAQRF